MCSNTALNAAAAPTCRLVKWMQAAMATERELSHKAMEEKDDLLKEKDALLEQKDEQYAKAVRQMTRDHTMVVQMLEAKAAAATAKYAAEVRSLQLDTLALSHDGYAWEQKCRKLQHDHIDVHVEHHNESAKLHHTLKQSDSVQRELRKKHLSLRRDSARQESVLKLELECARSRVSMLQQDLAARDRTLVAEAGLDPNTALATFQRVVSQDVFAAEHTFGRFISRGTDGQVYVATRFRNGVRRARAAKSVRVAQMGLARIVGEIQIGLLVNSPHVVPVYEVFRDVDANVGPVVLITMELMRVSLWDVLDKWGTLQEHVAALVMSHILSCRLLVVFDSLFVVCF